MSAKPGNKYALRNKGGGRKTKYHKSYAKQAYILCLLGATDNDLAEVFNVNRRTITRWKRRHEEFLSHLKKGKLLVDSKVAEALHKRALGFDYDEVTHYFENGELVKEVKIEKSLPPDPTAAIFWLKNRQPKLWRDSKHIDHTTKGDKIKQTRAERDAEIEELIKKHKSGTK